MREGGFVPATSVVSALDVDPYCAFCFSEDPAWLHVTSQRLFCTQCLPDPDADDGAAGRQASVRLRKLDDAMIW